MSDFLGRPGPAIVRDTSENRLIELTPPYSRPGPTRSPVEGEVAWAAGFLEGEASFCQTHEGYLRIEASQVNHEPIQRLREIFGGSVRLREARGQRLDGYRRSDIYIWCISGRRAEEVAAAIAPWLSQRRLDQIMG